jgi:hypothetical protein
MGKRANIKQVPPTTGGGVVATGVMTVTDAEIAVTAAHLAANTINMGVVRVPGCRIKKIFTFLNGYKESGITTTIMPDSNSTTAVVRLTNFADDCEPGNPDKIELLMIWESGNNPLGVVATSFDTTYVTTGEENS